MQARCPSTGVYEFQKVLQTKMVSVGRKGALLVGDGLEEREHCRLLYWEAHISLR